jgi:hypothetical protein
MAFQVVYSTSSLFLTLYSVNENHKYQLLQSNLMKVPECLIKDHFQKLVKRWGKYTE